MTLLPVWEPTCSILLDVRLLPALALMGGHQLIKRFASPCRTVHTPQKARFSATFCKGGRFLPFRPRKNERALSPVWRACGLSQVSPPTPWSQPAVSQPAANQEPLAASKHSHKGFNNFAVYSLYVSFCYSTVWCAYQLVMNYKNICHHDHSWNYVSKISLSY